MDARHFDAFARTLARPGSRRRLLGGGIGGAAAALGGRLGLAQAQTCAPVGEACTATEDCCDAVSCCSGVCLDLATFLSSTDHCGACNRPCDGTCDNGVCRPSGSLDCGSGVVDTLTDAAHCGGCHVVCPSGFCEGGNCVPCPGGTTDCGTYCADLTSDDANCGRCGNDCGETFECVASACRLPDCPAHLEPCPGESEQCCPPPNPCERCQPDVEICIAGDCLPIIGPDGVTCATGDAHAYVTRDVVAVSSDSRLTLAARTTTNDQGTGHQGGRGDQGEDRVYLSLAVNEGRTPQVRIDATASRDRGVTVTAEYGPAFTGVRNLTSRGAAGQEPVTDIDNRGAGVPAAIAVDPAFTTAAGELGTVLSGDLRACLGETAFATPVALSPGADGDAACNACRDGCGADLAACFPPAGVLCLSDPAGCASAIAACMGTYWQCLDGCASEGGC